MSTARPLTAGRPAIAARFFLHRTPYNKAETEATLGSAGTSPRAATWW